MEVNYVIQRVMNNNVVLAVDRQKESEVVLMGKGLGFGKKRGQLLDHNKGIEKVFLAGKADSMKDSYLRMLEEVNGDVVEICTEILLEAERKLGGLSDRSFIVVVDHISFAIEKLSKNIEIENPFVEEIKGLYPEEYAIGEFARKKIMARLQVDITDDEAGLHSPPPSCCQGKQSSEGYLEGYQTYQKYGKHHRVGDWSGPQRHAGCQ